jgi:hypothetical protein
MTAQLPRLMKGESGMSEREKLLVEYLQRIYELAKDDRRDFVNFIKATEGRTIRMPRLPNNHKLIAQVALEGLRKINTPEAPIWPFDRGVV